MIEAACEGGFLLGELIFWLWKSLEKIVWNRHRGSEIYVVPIWETPSGWGTPLPHHPLKALTGAEFAKMGCKILSL